MTSRFHHSGVVVSSLDSAIEFYRLGLGLEEVGRHVRVGRAIDQLVGYVNASLRLALLGRSDDPSHLLELIEYDQPTPRSRADTERNVIGASHLGFQVPDLNVAITRLQAVGARFLNPPAQLTPGRWASYFQDPDGNWLELFSVDEVEQ